MTTTANRPPIESLACINPECDHYAQPNQGNLKIRKIYGADQIRYLRCTHCGTEFSERKHTVLWNCKIAEERAIQVSRQLAEGSSLKSTARLTQTHPDTVRRIALTVGRHKPSTQAASSSSKSNSVGSGEEIVVVSDRPCESIERVSPRHPDLVAAIGRRPHRLQLEA